MTLEFARLTRFTKIFIEARNKHPPIKHPPNFVIKASRSNNAKI